MQGPTAEETTKTNV